MGGQSHPVWNSASIGPVPGANSYELMNLKVVDGLVSSISLTSVTGGPGIDARCSRKSSRC